MQSIRDEMINPTDNDAQNSHNDYRIDRE